MARAASRSHVTAWLPAGTMSFVRERAAEGFGFALGAGALWLAVALAAFDPGDASFNVATWRETSNLAGPWGAHVAQALYQLFGWAAPLIVVVLAAWGWRLTTAHRLTRPRLRLALAPLALAAPGAGVGALPGLDAGPLAGLAGGLFGDALAAGVARAGLVPEVAAAILLAGGFALGVAATAGAMGLSGGEWLRLGRGLRWLGTRTLRVAVIAGGFVAARFRPLGDDDAALVRDRLEPTLAPELPALPTTDAPAKPTRSRRPRPLIALREDASSRSPKQGALDLAAADGSQLPPLDLLKAPRIPAGTAVSEESLDHNARKLEAVLQDFGVKGQITQVRPGPVVTLYELEPEPGIRSSRVIGLADDIARSMSAVSARVAVIPGRNAIGIELPNAEREVVALRDLLGAPEYEAITAELTLALGKDIGGRPVIVDLARMPHLLVAGTTGSGKSVALNSMILSLLYRLPAERCRFIMIDPKMLELSVYDDIPHLIAPVVTEAKKAVVALKWTVREMENRYRLMSKIGVRNIAGFNKRLAEAEAKGEQLTRTVQTGFDAETGQPILEDEVLATEPLPLIVVIVDEMADLMLLARNEIEVAIQRLAQMARAAGIHLIMATQRPSVDVITGTIKANFPSRVSFQVTSKIDSRTILGEQGAEQLLGQGDMLYMAGSGRITRIHGPYVSEREVEQVVGFLKRQGRPDYMAEITEDPDEEPAYEASGSGDELYDRAVDLVLREDKCSTSFIQRHLAIGYNRAARLVERMEAEALVGKPNHVGKREVLGAGREGGK
ncbi:MAG: DNA translocase FtsK 4TM domain-containing protein [Alphaproteobacteria bacterium]